jgi:hypothetical protein
VRRSHVLVLRAFALWTAWVWGTRIWNIWRDDHGLGFKVVHSVLALVSVAFAVATWRIVSSYSQSRRLNKV